MDCARPRRVTQLPPGIVAVVAGTEHVLATTRGGRLHAWGEGADGRLGLGDEQPALSPKAVRIPKGERVLCAAAGERHTVVATTSGRVYAWGWAGDGCLGIGRDAATRPCLRPTPMLVALAAGEYAVSVAAGSMLSMVVSSAGTLRVCGVGGYGAAGPTERVYTPVVQPGLAGEFVVSVATSPASAHVLARTLSGKVYSWGNSRFGQLGHGDDRDLTTPREISALSRTE